ncbi:MAG: copper resistance protein CopC [Actinomycetes bacterium]
MRNLVRSKLARMAVIAAFVGLSTFLAPSAQANSVVSTVPAVGAVLSQAPNAISVSAATSLLPDGNSLTVTDPNNLKVDDGSLTIADTTAVVGLKPLTVTGIYTVSYTLLSPTDDPVTGSYTFLFNAPATVTSPGATPSPTVTSTVIPKKSTGSSSASITILVFLGIATIVALFLLWYARMIWIQARKGRHRRAHERGEK